jgi:hypothetical protein
VQTATKFLIAAAVVAAVAVQVRYSSSRSKKAEESKGSLACPPVPIDLASAVRGDFVILKLKAAKGSATQLTWGQIRSFSPTRHQAYIQVVGEFSPKGITPVKFGFRLNEKIVVDAKCIWDLLRVDTEFKGQVLCGPGLSVAGEHAVDTGGVEPGDVVKVIVASLDAQGTAWHEPLEVRVSLSPTKQIFHGIVVSIPTLSAVHGLTKYSALQFGRDCVIEV